ncbi:MAG TPA: type VI secretion protein, partial [Methanosarcina sp.]|nr:type VI secretion protein [Methanosarcina sp.]
MLKLHDTASRLQDTIKSFNTGAFQGKRKEEEETCPHRIRQTRNRKTILINCRECDAASSLNDSYCRKNIFDILQKEIHADCLVLARLYERDYEGRSLSSLYALAGLRSIIEAYRSIQVVPEACARQGKKNCELKRKRIINSLIETVEIDPLKAKFKLRELVNRKMQEKFSDALPA